LKAIAIVNEFMNSSNSSKSRAFTGALEGKRYDTRSNILDLTQGGK
jgi:hypothetical protein